MLKNIIAKAGDFCFTYRGLQFLPYFLVILAEFNHLKQVNESIPFEIFCFGITLFGVLIRILTIGFVAENTSGRNVEGQFAETLNTQGIYSIVRNPLYLGNFFIFLGVAVMTESWEIIVANTLLMTIIYTLIILREEEYLYDKFGDEYKNYADNVNCIIPSFKNFKMASRHFSLRKVFKNEHDTWLTTLLAFIGIELIRGYFEFHTLFMHQLWIAVSIFILLIWTVTKILKKAHLLD